MTLAQTIEVFEAFDDGGANGATVERLFEGFAHAQVEVTRLTGARGETDFVKILLPGSRGRLSGGKAPTLGVIGRLGGIGARPSRIGLVSDADGAIAAVAAALKIAMMQTRKDELPGDVLVTTHVCPNAPVRAHHPVEQMDSPIDIDTMVGHEVDAAMAAIISIDSTKANNFINHKGIAISPTVKDGYILRSTDELVRLLGITTGAPAYIFPVSTQDITPYNNGVYHLNSILQPATKTSAPVIGLAICSGSVVPGSATGSSQEVDIALAVKFTVEVAKAFTSEKCEFYHAEELAELTRLYGSLQHLQRAVDA